MLQGVLRFSPVFFWLLLFFYLARIPLAIEAYRNQKKKRTIRCRIPTISVIIPARNEAINLAILLESLNKQSLKPEEIIVVDDNSEDETAEIARKAGVRLINPGPLPAGWNGKSHACFRGAEAASGFLLIFLDADTRLEKEGLEVMLNLYLEGRGLVSIQPYHRMQKAYERLSAFFNLIVFLNMNISSYIPALNRSSGAFGPCILCSRTDYFNIGGHQAVRGEVIEDMALARLAQKKGLPVWCYAGRGVISFRMYPGGLRSLIEGWTKNFASGAASTGPWFFLVTFGWVAGAMSGPVDMVKGIAGNQTFLWQLGAALYVIYGFQIYIFLKKLGNFGFLTSILYPFNLLFFILVFLRSMFYTVLLGFVHWKGRKLYVRRVK